MNPGRSGLALLAAVIALAPPLLVPRTTPRRPAPVAVRAPARPALPPGPLLARLADRLPPSDTLHLAALTADGTLTLEVDTPDPQALRAALAGDPLLAGLATVTETIVADAGMRVRLARPGAALPAAMPVDPTGLTGPAARAGLLVERRDRALVLSGAEASAMSFIGHLGPTTGLAPWRIEQAGGGAVRLTATPVRVSRSVFRPIPSRALFAIAAPVPVAGAPDLVGIAGRLGRDAVALVREEDGGVASVAVGDATEGWRLETLTADAALFSRGGERIRVAVPTGE